MGKMFVSHDINSNKKKFQKPNILRKKPSVKKASNVNKKIKTDIESAGVTNSLLTSSVILDPKSNDIEVDKIVRSKSNNNGNLVKKSIPKLKIEDVQDQLGNNYNITSNVTTKDNIMCIENCQSIEENQSLSLNVESFLLNDEVRQNITIYDNDLLNKEIEEENKHKWCLDFSQDSQKIIVEQYDSTQVGSLYLEQKSDVATTMVPLAAVSSIRKNKTTPADDLTTMVTVSLAPNRSNTDKDNFHAMTITALPTISQPTEAVQGDYALTTSIDDLNVSTISENANLVKDEEFQSIDAVTKISIEQLTQRPVRFKCDEPDCNKEFLSEQKLNKHKSTHNKNISPKIPRLTTVECPVKKILENGVEEPCGKIFHVRGDLIKHLNEDHTIDEAIYRCTECSRRFFWASGLRAHARAHSGRERDGRLLACPWPGCSRVFRQPCRLREHARAHTGDKPYSCRYPNCGWSFRTASKLLRHARRHTGDRRHACAACGRAFLRREHLRDHAARHHAHARRLHDCPHADCQQTFTNMSSLYMHMKKVHKKEENNPPPVTATSEEQEMPKVVSDHMFMVSLLEPSSLEEEVEESSPTEGHSARTHCTWPLASRAERYQHADAYVLEEDVQVEQSESSESNIYTVRSDLFLHGNVLHNEDSEQMGRCVRVAEAEVEGESALALDADLLLDAPSVHLDQEELYTDPVDESAFRVFLLSGEELT